MPIDPNRLCACHGEPMLYSVCTKSYRCNIARRAAVRRYAQKDNRKQRFNRQTNARRIKIGRRYVGMMPTPDAAQTINAHIKRRRDAFERQQARAKA